MLSEKTYKQILSPLISEKSAIQKSVSNTYVFKVNKDATKTEIKKATEEICISAARSPSAYITDSLSASLEVRSTVKFISNSTFNRIR